MRKYKTSEYVVAFIDVLGAKKMIESTPNSLQLIHNIYDTSILKLKGIKEYSILSVKVKIFSDNIVLYIKINPKDGDCVQRAISELIFLSAVIQEEFLKNKILLRGGITTGQFFADRTMVWGNALVRAYELESQVAIYPRIIIDPQIFTIYDYFENILAIKDTDDLRFVDYLFDEHVVGLSTHLKYINEQIQSIDNLKISQKWGWNKSYIMNLIERINKNNESILGFTNR